jgi:P4 family phage/plasmid primase-like protien
MAVKISVWVDKFVVGWSGDGGAPPQVHPVMPIAEAMAAEYGSDAHFVPYRLRHDSGVDLPDCPRLKVDSLGHLRDYGVGLVFDCAVADIDHADTHAGRTPEPPQEWRDKVWKMALEACPGCLAYETRSGMRVVVALPESMQVGPWQAWCKRFRQYLRDQGLPVDEIQAWAQPYRLPFVDRDGQPQRRRAEIREPAVFEIPRQQQDQPQAMGDGIDPRQPFRLPRRIPEGQRHHTLVRYAAQLRWQGLDHDAILGQIHEVNRNRCRPAAPDTEIAEIARWASVQEDGQQARQAAAGRERPADADPEDGDEEPFLLGDHTEIAKRVAEHFTKGSPVQMVADLGKIWRYDPQMGYWREVAEHELSKLIHSYSGIDVRNIGPQGNVLWRPMRINDSTVVGAIKSLHRLLAVPGFFASAPAGIAFKDCWVQVTADGVAKLPHDPSQKAMSGYDFGWTDETPDVWLTMLADYWGHKENHLENVTLLNEFLGASLCGIAPKFQQALGLVGKGSNGKSQILRVATGLFPDGTVTSVSPQMFGVETYRAMLAASRLNVVGELPEKRIKQEAAASIKALISGDEIVARHLRENPFKFRPLAGHVVACNALPDVEDDSDGFYRRFILLMFDRMFSPHGGTSELGDEVLAIDKARIVCYALRCVPTLIKRGKYKVPKESVDEVTAWRNGQDEVALFLSDRTEPCEPVRGNGTDGESLYMAYAVWAPQNGYEQMNKNRFLNAVDKRAKRFYDNGVQRRMYPVTLTR